MKTRNLFARSGRILFTLVVLSVMIAASPLMAASQPIELKLGFATAATDTDPYNITSVKFAELIAKYSNGKYKVNLYPNSQLGNETDMIKNLTVGAMDLGVITNAPVGSFINAFMVLDLPFIFPSENVAHQVLDGDVGKMLLPKLEKLNIKGLAFSEGGFRHMINNVRPVRTPADTKGIKFRVMQTPIYIAMFQSLGSNAVPMGWGEVFTAVQQKVIDGLEIPIPVIYANKFYEVTEYLALTDHLVGFMMIVMNNDTFKKLTPAQQKALDQAAKEASRFNDELLKKINADIEKQLFAKMKVTKINNAPWREAAKDVYKSFLKYDGFGDLYLSIRQVGEKY